MDFPNLSSKVPSIEEYSRLTSSEFFGGIEGFSNNFLSRHKQALSDYSRKWVPDPLHQWSRQWEYPYVASKIADHLSASRVATYRILDAGSGITFFPYFIKDRFNGVHLYSCDRDKELEATYSSINANENQKVDFFVNTLHKTSFAGEFFDCVYCISVLEHTDNYQEIIDEFYRIIKPGGRLVVTFDISIDGSADISPQQAAQLLKGLKASFSAENGEVEDEISLLLKSPQIVTTKYAHKKLDAGLMPWTRARFFREQLKTFLTSRRVLGFPPLLTVYCTSLTKNPQ